MSDRRRRVLVLNHFAVPRGYAGGTRHVELFTNLEEWDHLIIASDLNPQTGGRIASERGLAVVKVPRYSRNGARRVINWTAYAVRAFLLGLRQPKIDLVYGSSPHLLTAVAAWLIAVLRRRPFVMEVRDLWPQILVDTGTLTVHSPFFRALSAVERFLYRRARAIVVMAEGSRLTLIDQGVAPAKIHLIPNGADPDDFQPSDSRPALRERYGFTTFTAIYTGAHGPANGLDLLLDSAPAASDLGVDIVLVGGGLEKDRLMARVRDEELVNVRFLDPVPKAMIPDLLVAADLGLHILADVKLFQTSVSPNKVFDYMAAGLPLLTNCPGMVSDLVHAADAGWTVEPDAIADGIAVARASVGGGRGGRAWIAANQSRTQMRQRLKKTLEMSVRPRGSSRSACSESEFG